MKPYLHGRIHAKKYGGKPDDYNAPEEYWGDIYDDECEGDIPGVWANYAGFSDAKQNCYPKGWTPPRSWN